MSIALNVFGGLMGLVAGGELLVRGSSRLARILGVSPLIVGLTIVAFGTSMPELAVGVRSALAGKADLSLGNVIGSNIANVLLILGLAATIMPLSVSLRLIRIEVPLLIALSLGVWFISLDGVLSRTEGLGLLVCAVVYTAWSIRAEKNAHREAYEKESGSMLVPIACMAGGLIALVIGAGWFVAGASDLARVFKIPEIVIGLTVVAVGTSLPELVATLAAAVKGEADIAVGNVIGSNLFNLFFVLGGSAAFASDGLPVSARVLSFELPIMVLVAIACLPVFFTSRAVSRWEGILLLGAYAGYTGFLLLQSTNSNLQPWFSRILTWWAAPLVVLVLTVSLIRELRWRRMKQ